MFKDGLLIIKVEERDIGVIKLSTQTKRLTLISHITWNMPTVGWEAAAGQVAICHNAWADVSGKCTSRPGGPHLGKPRYAVHLLSFSFLKIFYNNKK